MKLALGLWKKEELNAETEQKDSPFDMLRIQAFCDNLLSDIQSLLFTGVVHLTGEDMYRFERYAVEAHNLLLANYEVQLRRFSDSIQGYHDRRVQISSVYLLREIAGLYESVKKLLFVVHGISEASGTSSYQELAALAGVFRSDYLPVTDLTLIGLGMRHLKTAAGYEGNEAYFIEEQTGEFYTYNVMRPVFYDKQRRTSRTGAGEVPWNLACTFSQMAVGKVKLHSGKANEQAWYDPSMREKAMHDKQISQLFPEAVLAEEFLVYYQPKVNLDNKELCGCEALVRWYHNGAIVPPMDFIPVLEREGTVCALDFYVFEHVCRDLRRWLDNGITPVRASVNFSQQHLQNDRLAERIVSIMKQYHIDSKYIEVELTEMSGSKNHDALLEFLRKMRDYGICTSIDDFGTGYSSLNMLREFKADIIKLDKSFIDRISLNVSDYRVDEIVIENIIRMAQELNLEIISEGVETEHQAEFLKRVHCNMAQGFLFDKPLPRDEFEKRLKKKDSYA